MATSGMQTGRPIEIRALTGLRIVAATWVVVHHFSVELEGPFREPLGPLWPLVQAGWLGVDLFFVLSGFVITHTYLEVLGRRPTARAVVEFVWARMARVWPVWALVTVLFFGWLSVMHAIDPVANGGKPDLHWDRLVAQLGLVQMWGGDDVLNSSYVLPGWSVSAEWFAYVCFPVVVLLLWRLRALPAPVAGVLGVACLVPFAVLSARSGLPNYEYPWLLRITGGFLGGAFGSLFVRRVRRTEQVSSSAMLLAAVCVVELVAVIAWAHWRGTPTQSDYAGVAVLVFPVLVTSLALSDRGLARWLAADWLVAGGRISYSLYVVHWAMLSGVGWLLLVTKHLPLGASAVRPFVFLHLMFATFLVAHLVHRGIEEPARVWLRDHGPSRWWPRAADVTVSTPEITPHPHVLAARQVPLAATGVAAADWPKTEVLWAGVPVLMVPPPRAAVESAGRVSASASAAPGGHPRGAGASWQ